HPGPAHGPADALLSTVAAATEGQSGAVADEAGDGLEGGVRPAHGLAPPSPAAGRAASASTSAADRSARRSRISTSPRGNPATPVTYATPGTNASPPSCVGPSRRAP